MVYALIVGLFILAVVVLVALPRGKAAEPTSEPRVDWHDVRERISPHFRGTVGVCTAFILFCSLLLILAEPSAIKYVWLIPLLVAVVYLMVWVRKTIENELVRGIIYVSVVVVLAITVGPTLPGSTPARPPIYTPDQLSELARMRDRCPGIKQTIVFTPVYVYIDPEGLCIPTIWMPGQCIYIRDQYNTGHGPFCETPGANNNIPHVIVAIRAADKPFPASLMLRPNYQRLNFRYAGD